MARTLRNNPNYNTNTPKKTSEKSIKKIVQKTGNDIFQNIMRSRNELGLNPFCPKCGRVMITKRKDKYSGTYFCSCSPDILLSRG